jgi:4,5-DOPA dioxygenase extradiol
MGGAARRMPVVFFGHGSPMNAIEPSRYGEAWRAIGLALPRPRAILCVSAHWYTRGTGVTAMAQPPTIHDFYGFPQALFDMQYPAPGDPALARRVRDLLAPVEVRLAEDWGLDHGTWSVLVHAYPQADVPVVQLALDGTRPASFHYELGRRLGPLRDEGVLIAGSGNVVHNLQMMRRGPKGEPYAWAERFEHRVRACLAARDHAPLVAYETLDEDARLAVPTPEHYLPLLYCIASQQDGETAEVAIDGIELGSISMLSVVIH